MLGKTNLGKRADPSGAHVMPRYADQRLSWSSTDQIYQVISHHTQTAIVPDSQEWFDWLNSIASFAFHGRNGHYTARKERKKRGETYWYAYLGTGKKLTKNILAKLRTSR